jgi:L-iditol 2-dehydrogenase
VNSLLAVLLDGKGYIALKDMPKPSPDRGEVVVKMSACGLCGTDVEKIKGEYTASMPVIGHEPAGVVIDVGEGVSTLKVGDRVFVHHHVPCNDCWYCRHNSETMCLTYKSTNIRPGGFSEYFLVPSLNIQKGGVLKLPSNVSFEDASLIEPLACCIRGLHRADSDSADRILVMGCGPVGQMHIKLLSLKGKYIIATDINSNRLEMAEKFGASHSFQSDNKLKENVMRVTDGLGADLSIIASSSIEAVKNAIECTRKGGKILLFGVPAKGSRIEFDLSNIFNSELSFITSYGATERETRMALGMLASGGLQINELVSHRFPLKNFEEALQLYSSGKGMKIVITN